jgi:hypothetical protein
VPLPDPLPSGGGAWAIRDAEPKTCDLSYVFLATRATPMAISRSMGMATKPEEFFFRADFFVIRLHYY